MKIRLATLISVYAGDRADWFDRALRSIEEQILPPWVDSHIYLAIDGPIDSDLEAVVDAHEPFIHKKVTILPNGGLANALNHLIKEMDGEDFIFRMDSDDVSLPYRYEEQIKYLRENPSVHIVGGDICEVEVSTARRRMVRFYNGSGDVKDYLCRGVPVAHPTVCMRREVLDVVPGYPVNSTNEDIAFWFLCAKAGLLFGNVPQVLLEFTIGDKFWQRRSVGKAFGELRCYMQGIYSLHGLTWRYIFPLGRFMLRLSPRFVVELAYRVRAGGA